MFSRPDRPTTRLARKAAASKGPEATKLNNRQKGTGHQEQNSNLEGVCQEDADSPTGQGSIHAILSVEEGGALLEEEVSEDTDTGRKEGQVEGATKGVTHATPKTMLRIYTAEEGQACLEKAQLVELRDTLNTNILAGVLVQISFFLGMSQAMRDTVRVVALLIAQEKPDGIGDSATEGIVDCMVDRLADVVKAAMQATVSETKLASTAITESSMQMTVTATLYQDTHIQGIDTKPNCGGCYAGHES